MQELHHIKPRLSLAGFTDVAAALYHIEEGLGLVVHVPSGCVAKINIP
jgi:hypothetical protein